MEKTIKQRDWSLPFAILILFALVLLSGCNLGGSDSEASAQIAPAPVAKQASYDPGKFQNYSKSKLEAALVDNKTVLLDFHADWCAVCVGNDPNVKQAFDELGDTGVVGFKVNYDTEKALKRQFSVNSQATFIVLKGGKEVKRTMGPQSVSMVKALLQS